MKFLLILFLPLFLSAQHLSETFSSFLPDTANTDLLGSYIKLTSGGAFETDHTGAFDFTAINSAGDSVVQDNVLKSTAYSVFLDSTNSQIYYLDSDAFDSDSNFTTVVVFEVLDNGGGTQSIYRNNGTRFGFYSGTANNLITSVYHDGTSKSATDAFDLRDTGVHVAVYRHSNSTGVDGYFDRTLILDEASWTLPIVEFDGLTMLGGYSLNGDNTPQFLTDVYVHGFFHYDSILTDQEILEKGYLAEGWYSKNGGVTRASFAYNQGIVNDTVYVNLADSTLPGGKQWSLTFDYGTDGAAFTSSSAYAWTENFSGDSLFFETTTSSLIVYTNAQTVATIPLGGTTGYIDNVILTTGNQGGVGVWGQHKQHGQWGQWR